MLTCGLLYPLMLVASRALQPVCRRQAAQIDKERQQHKRLSNLFTTAYTVNLVLFLIAAYCLVNLVESFSKMEDQTVYDPYAVRCTHPTHTPIHTPIHTHTPPSTHPHTHYHVICAPMIVLAGSCHDGLQAARIPHREEVSRGGGGMHAWGMWQPFALIRDTCRSRWGVEGWMA